MPDAAAILRANGMGLVEDLILAAQMENIPLPVAATIIAGESWGKNIWGADGGLNVRTNGTYKPRTLVTKSAYLAYRTEMRAKRIIRQGCGPAQCTSAQYQDTADALGGCWVPLANMRSGFRGMGALMRQYGTRNGARRYNGSGPQAEKYADSFMARLAVWEGRLRDADVAPRPGPAPTPPAPRVPGGIESMAFTDGFTDWAGNKQTVASWMNHVDKRLFELSRAVVEPSIPSQVDGQRRAAGTVLGETHDDVRVRLTVLEQKLDRLLAALPK